MPILTPTGELFLQAMEAAGVARVPIPRCTCGLEAHTVVAEVDRHGIPVESRLCLHCGTVRLAWQPAGGWLYLSGWYRRLHTQRGDEEQRREWGRLQFKRFIEFTGLAREGRLVDIGGDVGGFADEAREYGFDAVTVEMGETIPRDADVYTMLHTLEHIPDCIGQLRAMASANISKLFVVVPDLMMCHLGEDAQSAMGPINLTGIIRPIVGDLRAYWTIAHPWNWTARSIAFPFAHAGWWVKYVEDVEPGELATVGSLLVCATPGPRTENVAKYIDRNRRNE